MSPKRSHVFSTSLRATPTAAVVSAPQRPDLAIDAPPEIGGGSGDRWSPEHLLLAAVSSCLLTTFRFFAAQRGLAFRDFTCRAHGTVEKTPKGLAFTRIELAVNVEVSEGSFAVAREVLARAERACLVTHSLAVPVVVEAVVTIAHQDEHPTA